MNSNADFFVPGATAIRFPTQGSSDEIPSGSHIFHNDDNLLDGSLEGIQIPDIASSQHMKIEEQQIDESESL
jgi:hypothetical protein